MANQVIVKNKGFSAAEMAELGIKRVNKSAVSALAAAGGYVPEGISPEMATVAQSVIRNEETSERAKRNMAIALGLMEDSGEWQSLTSPNGKPFKSAQSFFSALIPSLADSSIRAYMSTARTIYLPAMRGELDAEFMPLAKMNPGSLTNITGALNREEDRAELKKLLPNYTAEDGTIQQKQIREAVQKAKENIGTAVAKEDGTSPTPKSDADNAAAVEKETLRVAIKRVMMPDLVEDEIHYTIGEDRVSEFKAMIENALKDGANALNFVNALRVATFGTGKSKSK